MNRNQLLAQFRQTIAREGWVVTGVAEDNRCSDPRCTTSHGLNPNPFLYTAGLTDAGLPELLLEGVAANDAARVLNALAKLATGAELTPGTPYEVRGQVATVEPVNQPEGRRICKVAAALYGGHKVRVLRVSLVPVVA